MVNHLISWCLLESSSLWALLVLCSLSWVCPTPGQEVGGRQQRELPHTLLHPTRQRGELRSERGMGMERMDLEERRPWGLVQKSSLGKKAKVKEVLAPEQD